MYRGGIFGDGKSTRQLISDGDCLDTRKGKGLAPLSNPFFSLVEAAGIEPASEGIPLEHLHAYPAF